MEPRPVDIDAKVLTVPQAQASRDHLSQSRLLLELASLAALILEDVHLLARILFFGLSHPVVVHKEKGGALLSLLMRLVHGLISRSARLTVIYTLIRIVVDKVKVHKFLSRLGRPLVHLNSLHGRRPEDISHWYIDQYVVLEVLLLQRRGERTLSSA